MKNYSVRETTLIVFDREIIGFTDETDALQIGRLEDSFGHLIGNRSEMIVFDRSTRAGQYVMKLWQTHEDNEFLSNIVASAENGAFVPVPVLYKDNLGNDIFTGAKGYMTKPADATRAREPASQEWRIIVERLDMLHGTGQIV